jgi:hypothetical protein
VHFPYTPTHASWVNMIECFFSILGKQGLSQSVHTSKRQLKEFLLNYIVPNNKNPKPFVWTKGPREAPAHHRGHQGISGGSPAQTQEAASQGE